MLLIVAMKSTVELTEEDTTLILACDGVWDVFSNEQAVAIAEAQPTAARAAIALRGSLVFPFTSID